jgi:simple sugar transport system substrate-binding protein
VLRERGVTWKVVVTGSDAEAGVSVVARALREDPSLRVVLCTGQADTTAAGLAIEREFAHGEHVAAGFDLSPEILRLIQAGHVRFTIDQQPYVQGFFPVVQLALYCHHGILPGSMNAGAGIIDRSNVDLVLEQCRKGYR